MTKDEINQLKLGVTAGKFVSIKEANCQERNRRTCLMCIVEEHDVVQDNYFQAMHMIHPSKIILYRFRPNLGVYLPYKGNAL